MNQGAKKYHPAMIIVELLAHLRGLLWPFLFLFILKATSTETWVIWGRYFMIIAFFAMILLSILKWHYHRYELTRDSIVVREGIFVKKQRTVSFERIQNQESNTTFVHRWFGLTSLTLETGTTGENARIPFPVITQEEKQRIVQLLEQRQTNVENQEEETHETFRTIHFKSTKRDLVKASFTSLSFLAIFPLLSAIYFNLDDFFQIEETAVTAFDYLLNNWWMLIILFIIAMILSVAIGYFQTNIKYGNFVISDDNERIYIDKGVGKYISYSIPKHKVQAVMIEQTLLKRMLGLASIKLISAGGIKEENNETSTLYPFMPKQQAYQILHTILPTYRIKEHMKRFPVKVLWLKLIHPYYVTLITFIVLAFLKSEWLWLTAIIFALSVLSRILDYWFTSYIRHGNTVQIRKGGFTNETFVTHRERIQQITVKHSWLQRKFGVATLQFTNRAKPIHESELYGVSKQEASTFFNWYHGTEAGQRDRSLDPL